MHSLLLAMLLLTTHCIDKRNPLGHFDSRKLQFKTDDFIKRSEFPDFSQSQSIMVFMSVTSLDFSDAFSMNLTHTE